MLRGSTTSNCVCQALYSSLISCSLMLQLFLQSLSAEKTHRKSPSKLSFLRPPGLGIPSFSLYPQLNTDRALDRRGEWDKLTAIWMRGRRVNKERSLVCFCVIMAARFQNEREISKQPSVHRERERERERDSIYSLVSLCVCVKLIRAATFWPKRFPLSCWTAGCQRASENWFSFQSINVWF